MIILRLSRTDVKRVVQPGAQHDLALLDGAVVRAL